MLFGHTDSKCKLVSQIQLENWFVTIDISPVRRVEEMLCHMSMSYKASGTELILKKRGLSPKKRTTFLGVVWDSTMMQAHLSPARGYSIPTTVRDIKLGQKLSVLEVQRFLGLMAAVANSITLGLLHMRLYEFWLKSISFHPLCSLPGLWRSRAMS